MRCVNPWLRFLERSPYFLKLNARTSVGKLRGSCVSLGRLVCKFVSEIHRHEVVLGIRTIIQTVTALPITVRQADVYGGPLGSKAYAVPTIRLNSMGCRIEYHGSAIAIFEAGLPLDR
jgi:hypothetical protein